MGQQRCQHGVVICDRDMSGSTCWRCEGLDAAAAEIERLHERISGLTCSSPNSCPGPEFAADGVCSVCLFRSEVGR